MVTVFLRSSTCLSSRQHCSSSSCVHNATTTRAGEPRPAQLLLERAFPRDGASSSTALHAAFMDYSSVSGKDAMAAKTALLESVIYTDRGANADLSQRGLVEELQVGVESCSGPELDYSLLAGLWRLVYTTAVDVVPIIQAEKLLQIPLLGMGPLEVGEIYQRFSTPEEGRVENITRFSTPLWLQPKDGITLTVVASYQVESPHRISLVFQEAQLGRLNISPTLETLLAPALLPRSSLNHRLLLGLKELNLRFPFRTIQQQASGRSTTSAGYLLTYLDEDMLIGRATSTGGSFIFVRDDDDM